MDESVTSINSRFVFVIFGSFYFFVLLVSYLLAVFYPFFTPYGWFVIPVVANFFVGYLAEEVDTAAKIIIACFFLHTGIVIGLLNIPLVYDAFISWFGQVQRKVPAVENVFSTDDPLSWMVIVIPGYPIMHIVLGIAVSGVGIAVRDYSSYLIAVRMRLGKKMKQIIEKLSSKV